MLRNGASSHRFLDPFIRRRTRQRRGVITLVAAPGDVEVTAGSRPPSEKAYRQIFWRSVVARCRTQCRRACPHRAAACAKRKKKGSNADWYNPFDPEAKISKMKDGSTHLSHKEEHAVDMDTGAVVAVTLDGGTAGGTTTLEGTLAAAEQNREEAREHGGKDSKSTHEPSEVVADKGYHSKMVMLTLQLAGWRGRALVCRRRGCTVPRSAIFARAARAEPV
jgi:hypothetical protein